MKTFSIFLIMFVASISAYATNNTYTLSNISKVEAVSEDDTDYLVVSNHKKSISIPINFKLSSSSICINLALSARGTSTFKYVDNGRGIRCSVKDRISKKSYLP